MAPNSRRVDISQEMRVPFMRRQAGKRCFDVYDAKYADMTPMFQVIKEVVKEREGAK